MTTDHSLLQDIRAGQARAFERLIRQHRALVLHMIGRLINNPEDVRELCQEVFLRVHTRLHQFRGESSLATWIGSIAFSVGAAWLRRKRIPLVEVGIDEDGDSALLTLPDPLNLAEFIADEDTNAHLHRAIDALPPMQRTLITLYYLDELSVEEIAAMTAHPVGTVKNYLFRARSRLRRELSQKLAANEETSHGH